jgi:hypothetical protein
VSVAAILQQLAQQAGAARRSRGSLVGDAIGSLSQLPGQIMADREHARAQQQIAARQRWQDEGVMADRARADRDDRRGEEARTAEQRLKAGATEILMAYHGGTPNDPATNNLEAGKAKALELGMPTYVDVLEELHHKEQQRVRAGQPKMPEFGTSAHEVQLRTQTLMQPRPVPDDGVAQGPATPGLAPEAAALQAYDDQRAATTKPTDTRSAVHKEWTDYKSEGGKLPFDEYMTMDANRKAVQVNVAGGGNPDNVRDAVASMKAGTAPPIMPGRASKDYLAVMAESRRQGFDLAQANTDWFATKKHTETMNGAQQLRLNQAINALPEMLDNVAALSAKWKGGRFPVLNKANLALAKGGAYGQDVASVANQLDAQIADVVADLGNVYMGGNSPTDHALGLAGKSLGAEWSEKVLHDMVALAKKNVVIRRNSIATTGVAGASADNPYDSPPPAHAPAGMVRVVGPNGEKGSMPSASALPPGWRKEP